MSKKFKPLHEHIADKLIAALQAGTSPFQKPWTDIDGPAFTIPINPSSGKNYRGMNSLWLSMQGYNDPRWLTLKQASFLGYKVTEGAKATLINFVKTHDIKAIRDDEGNKIKEDGKTKVSVTELDKPKIMNAWVFNAQQIEGMPSLESYLEGKIAEQKWTPIERAESLLMQSKAQIGHGGNEAYYSKFKDAIQLPLRAQFETEKQYYAVALHELGHWTGHKTRLDRPMEGKFGSESYAREELRAEIASLMIGSELGIGHDFGQHAAYVGNWIKILQNEPFELFKASADAQRIFDFVLSMEQKQELKQDTVANMNLGKGESIPYNNNVYTVADIKGKILKIEDMNGKKFNLKPTDGLYRSLVEARNNPPLPELELEETHKHKHQIKR